MTGAQFSVPEIYLSIPADNTASDINQYDHAVLNIRYVDGAGNPGSMSTWAVRLPNSGTASHPSDWWLTGNQQTVDINFTAIVRRAQQFGPNLNAADCCTSSRYQSGLHPGISDGGPNASTYDAVRIKGPGLPDSGIWFYREIVSGQSLGFAMADQRNTSASDTSVPSTFTDSCDDCVNYWLVKTHSLTDLTYITGVTGSPPEGSGWNQAAGNAPPRVCKPHPSSPSTCSSYAPENSYNGLTGTKPAKGNVYTFELAKSGALIGVTVKKYLTTDLIDPAQGPNIPWNSLGPNSTAGLNPTGALTAPQSQMTIDWVQNPAAQQIKSVGISMLNGDDDSQTAPAKGATSFVAIPTSAGGNYFTGLSGTFSYGVPGTPDNGYREYYFNYRMSDGSTKSDVFSYAP